MAQALLNGIIKAALGVAALGATLQTSAYVVEGGHRAVLFDRLEGVKEVVKTEGLNFLIPILQVKEESYCTSLMCFSTQLFMKLEQDMLTFVLKLEAKVHTLLRCLC
jgi:hypothetical protein